MYEELFELLSELGLGAAARPLCDLILDLTGEAMSLQLLHQEIRNVLHVHSGDNRVDDVIARLIEMGFAGLTRRASDENEGAAGSISGGTSEIPDSKLLRDVNRTIVVDPSLTRFVHETARGWLDIDGGIYFDVRQHSSGTDSER